MHISVAWLNQYLDRPVTADEAERVLTHVGFPIESREERPGGDATLDVEVTSNRGDVLSHLGCAREIAAATGRRVVEPAPAPPTAAAPPTSPPPLTLTNTQPAACPRFTAQVIRGVKVGPSPERIRRALESVGQRPINNVVDVTNFVALEYGQPTHVFDLDRLAGAALVVRFAREGEALRTLDGKARTLKSTDLVVADDRRAQSLAGVIGGADSEVTDATTNVVLEAATWDPVTIRTAARRLGIRTEASHRFERRVHPATIDAAARRAAAMIVELAGGTPAGPMLDQGAPLPERTKVSMRTERCRMMLGHALPDEAMLDILRALGLQAAIRPGDVAITGSTGATSAVGPSTGPIIECVIPPHRFDLAREIDLIEEVARIAGLDRVPTLATLPVAARAPQRTETVRRRIAAALTGLGFYETVTFSFVRPEDAADFMPPGLTHIDIDDDRRGEEPTLRPSVIPSLLRCRRANQAGQVEQPGGIRLFETAPVFAGIAGGPRRATSHTVGEVVEQPGAPAGDHVENRNLALLMDVPGPGKKRTPEDLQAALRTLRGVIEQVAVAAGLTPDLVRVEPMDPARPVHAACDPAASGLLTLGGAPLGYMALLAPAIQKKHDLDTPVVYAEVGMGVIESATAPVRVVQPLPQFPAIDRDLSIVVDEGVRWAQVEAIVRGGESGRTPEAASPAIESLRYVTTFRDEAKVGKGKKVVTLRLRFRAADRTLRSEETEPPVAGLVSRLSSELGAVLRA